MTALATQPAPADHSSAPRPVARTRPAPGPSSTPRLLLPPLSQAPAAAPAEGTPPIGATLPRVRSVLAPVTETAWAIAARRMAETSAPDLPDPGSLCGAVVIAAIEALRNARPLAQLARWVSPAVYESLSGATCATLDGRPRTVTLREPRVCRISRTVAEGTVVVRDGERVRAAAVRFEVHRGAWRATALQIG